MTPSRPMSPEITDHGAVLRFSGPVRAALVAVTVMAVVALGILLVPRGGSTPIAETSPSATATATPEATAVPSEPGPTGTPNPTLEPSPTLAPPATPTASPIAPSWVSVDWSAPFVPFPHESGAGWPGISIKVDDMMVWNGEYIGVGGVDDGLACSEAAFFRSADGLHWEITFRASSGDDRTPTMCPRFIAPLGDGLVGLAQERIWRSADGIAWQELDPSGLRGVWTMRGEELIDLAAGPAGMVVIGRPANTYDSIVAFSDDGLTWSNVDLPAREQAIAWDVTAWGGRFVIVGRDGRPDEGARPMEPYTHPGVGAPAAWTSVDGRSWTQADVQGDAVKAGVLSQVVAGSGGLMATGNDNGVDAVYEEIDELGVGAWSSVDGSTWQKIGRLDALVPEAWMIESDGRHIAALRDDGAVWISSDGRAWQPLSVTGELDVPSWALLRIHVGVSTTRSAWDWKLWVTPAGLSFAGTADSDDGWATRQFQVGTAVEP